MHCLEIRCSYTYGGSQDIIGKDIVYMGVLSSLTGRKVYLSIAIHTHGKIRKYGIGACMTFPHLGKCMNMTFPGIYAIGKTYITET
jgi:hypothetical protein